MPPHPSSAPRSKSAPGHNPTLDQLLVGADGNATAIVDGPHRCAPSTIRTESASLAGGLRTLGVGRRDVVAWQLPNWHEAIALFHACWLTGAVAAPLHHRNGEHEIAEQLALLDPRVVIAAPGMPAGRVPRAIQVRGDGGYEALLDHAPESGGASTPDDAAVVLFTSGSVDGPKAVLHTHGSLSHKARTMPRVHGLSANDVVLMPAPLAHVSGLLNGVLLPGAVGMSMVLMDRWDPSRALRLIAAERVSFMVGPPTFFVELMEAPSFSPEQVASLRLISCGGAAVSPAFVDQASACLGARVKRSYGSTEAPTVTTWHEGDPPERAATTDGRAVCGVELRVVAPGTGRRLPQGHAGELWVRGPGVCAGYLGTQPGDSFTTDGWFRTGDLARLDAEGWLTVVGRHRDVIIRGGENIVAAEVEAALERHPAVDRAVAVGVPHDRLGEVVAAAIAAEDSFDLDACRAWFAESGVARFKTPAHLLHLTDLPQLGSGKPDRRAVRELLMAAAESP